MISQMMIHVRKWYNICVVVHIAFSGKKIYLANNNTFMVANIPDDIKEFGPDRTFVIAPEKIYKKTIDSSMYKMHGFLENKISCS